MSPPPPESVSMTIACCACNNALTREGLRFPKSQELRNKWVDIIMSKTPDYPGKKELLDKSGLQLCVEHFESKMLIQKKNERGITTYALRKGGMPTLFDSESQLQNGHHPSLSISNGNLVDSTTKSDDEDIEICYEMIPTSSEVKVTLPDTNPDLEVMDIDKTQNSVPAVKAPPQDDILTNHASNSNAGTEEACNVQPSINDVIPSLPEFSAVLKLKNDRFYDPWKIFYQESSVLFLMFDADCKYLDQSFTVNENLKVSVFYHGQPFSNDELKELLGADTLLDSWTKFKKLILFLHTITEDEQHHTLKLKHACKLIKECIENATSAGFTEKQIKKLKFSLNQIEVSDGQNIYYTDENLQWAMNTYTVNRVGYAKIYESDFMTLPHPASLEIFKRQAGQADLARKQQLIRNKFVVKKPFQPNAENGARSPSAQSNDFSLLGNKNSPQQITLNNTTSVNPHSKSGLPVNNDPADDDDDDICEIQLLQD